jgi:predicted adenine nucleotide alpha hydrolase (AANH) superfamily ATPase
MAVQTINKKVLLHVCCAPDATVPWPELSGEGYETAGFFYGSNVHPLEEYEKRRDAVRHVAKVFGKKLFEAPYRPSEWVHNLAIRCNGRDLTGKEGGLRCALCFREQFEATAKCALEMGFPALCTTLTISPHKNPGLVNGIGKAVAKRHGLEWIERIWRRNDGFRISVARSRELGLYRQNYCGCLFSIGGE